jgi:hypothetical protein
MITDTCYTTTYSTKHFIRIIGTKLLKNVFQKHRTQVYYRNTSINIATLCTFASFEFSQTLKKISHAEYTSPEKNSSLTVGSGAVLMLAMYSTIASQNFETALDKYTMNVQLMQT